MSSIFINGENIIDANNYLNNFIPTPFSISSTDKDIKIKLESYDNINDVNKLFQYYDFCILINKASNLKDDNKRICDITLPWLTSSGKKNIDFSTMIAIYNKCIIQKDYNIKFTSIFYYTFNILNKRINDCKKNNSNYLCENKQYTYKILKLMPYKYKGIK